MRHRVWARGFAAQVVSALAALTFGTAFAAETGAGALPPTVKDGKIAYVLTHRQWAAYQSKDGKDECPKGMNMGPREQFAALFPKDGPKRTAVESYMMREGLQWLPRHDDKDPFPFIEATGKISFGMNIDGKVDANDWTSPDGEKGIDNEMYRAIGCIANFRGPSVHPLWWYENEYVRRYNSNRFMFEISGVDSLVNDGDVTVNSYRGMDDLLIDAVGDELGQVITPGGTQRIDERWGKFAQSTWKGKIVDGTLITEASDVEFPIMGRRNSSAIVPIKGMRFQLKLTPERANGVLAGYTVLEDFGYYINSAWPTYNQSNGEMYSGSLMMAMMRLADGYPDPQTGKMTAISSALNVRFTQVNIDRTWEKPNAIATKSLAKNAAP